MKKLSKIIALLLCAVLSCAVLSSCGKDSSSTAAKKEIDPSLLKKESSFVIALYPEYAPIACERIESLVKDGFYDGLGFTRVYKEFMAQAGDATGTDKPSVDPIKGEFAENGVKNDLSHKRGIVSMARRGNDNDSATCQFFIVYSDKAKKSLDGKYAAFGEVVEGMEVVDSFLNIEMAQGRDKIPTVPTEPITILKAEVEGIDANGHTLCRFYMQVGNTK